MIAREGGGKVFFLYDRLSARATITDGQGGIQGRQSHLPFGEELVATGTTDKHRFTSYERDSETGTDYAVNRGYSASIGRFLQADPYRASGGIGDPKSWNRYSYTRNNPTNRTDRLGLDDDDPIEGGNWTMDVPAGGDFIDPFFGDMQRLLDGDGFFDPRNLSGGNPPAGSPQRRTSPVPKILGKARFSEQRFRDCMHQLFGNGTPERSSAIDKFLNGRGQGTEGEYAIAFDYSLTAAQIGNLLRQNGYNVNGDQIAAYMNEFPDRIFFASDVFPERRGGVLGRGEFGAAILFHEIGNWFRAGVIFGAPNWSTLPGGGYWQRNPMDPDRDGDAGAALEECMYGGFVHHDGNVWNVPRRN